MMEDLCSDTSRLTEILLDVEDDNDKEKIVFQHISKAERLNSPLEDFPSDLDWFNTLEPLSGVHLQGKIVVLDFFTYCCINCLHVIPHLRQLEENFSVADGLVVIGVHSAKFDNEKKSENILLALQRYSICHPVVNDKECLIWNKFGISCWPTLIVLGPCRQPLFGFAGEGHKDELLLYVKIALKFYKEAISSHQLPVAACDRIVTSTLLKFPGKISRWGNIFAVSDSGNHRIIVFDDTNHIKFKIGGKAPGFKDGPFQMSRFNSPQGLCFYDADRIYVADTENHAIRLIDLHTLTVSTVVGNGRQGTDYEGGKIGGSQEISSPWDVCVVPCSDVEVAAPSAFPSLDAPFPPPPAAPSLLSDPPSSAFSPPPPPSLPAGDSPPPPSLPSGGFPPPPPSLPSGDFPPPPPSLPPPPPMDRSDGSSSSKAVLIAAAGTHQIWAYFIEKSLWWKGKTYDKDICVAIAGSGKEQNRNNRFPLLAAFAQPSGLAYSKEFKSVFIADSESSSIRKLSLKDGSVSHVVGGARSPDDLFSYGDADGKAYDAKLQHPLGVVWSSKDKCLFVCDTYNHKVKKVSVAEGVCSSLHDSGNHFSEPSGGCLNERGDVLYVCDTNNNCVKTVSLTDRCVERLQLKEKSEKVSETPLKDVWEAETSLSTTGGTLTLQIEFFPPEVHGKCKAQTDDAKLETKSSKGTLSGNSAEFVFSAFPSDADDVLHLFFDLVLCGSETCSFKKLALRVLVRRKDTATGSVVCKLRKNLV